MVKEYRVISHYKDGSWKFVYTLHPQYYRYKTLVECHEAVKIWKDRCKKENVLIQGLPEKFETPVRYEIKYREIPEYEVIEIIGG